jgi:hypothetical protein
MSIKRLGRQKGNDYPAGLNLSNYGSYQVTKSLRFRAAAPTYLSRSPASTSSTLTKITYSVWIKRGGAFASYRSLFAASTGASNDEIRFNTSDELEVLIVGGSVGYFQSAAKFRDASSWYHIVVSVDTTQATALNRMLVWVNGVSISPSGGVLNPAPTQNTTFTGWNNSGKAHRIGIYTDNSSFPYDGQMTEVYMIDGQALTPFSFGATDPTTGQWQPVTYTGTYGTNGFYLPFTNTTSTFTLGNDAGNGNNWTTNNFSLTAGVTYDSMTDVPTLTNASAANYPTSNPLLNLGGNVTLSNGNLTQTRSGNGNYIVPATMAIPAGIGKWYWEVTVTTQNALGNFNYGVIKNTISNGTWDNTADVYWNPTTGSGVRNRYNTASAGVTWSVASGDLLGFALDATTGDFSVYKNGTLVETWSNAVDTTFSHFPFASCYSTGEVFSYNFGQRPFAYTPPTGFVALNTFNLPDPAIKVGNKHFDAKIWTGNGTAQSINNDGVFQPDLVWVKQRNGTYRHQLVDSIRGVTKSLFSSDSDAEGTYQGVTAFNFNGFSVGTELGTNESGSSFVGWQWKGGNTSVTNTNGTITSQVSANPTAGFSVVTYTGPGSGGGTIGHGLGVAPKFIIAKNRSASESWRVYHTFLGATKYINLNATAAATTDSAVWTGTEPTSTVFGVANDSAVSGSGNLIVAYCFAPIAGYSAFGSYTGNASTDGPFIYTGFKPKFLMTKRTDSATSGDWNMVDTTRTQINPIGAYVYANQTAAEGSAAIYDILSNGFKIRETGGGTNASGSPYIYMAFAEYPFKNGNAAIYNIN